LFAVLGSCTRWANMQMRCQCGALKTNDIHAP
jgi:hypothetical protein